MGDPNCWRSAVRELELCIPQYAPNNNYIVLSADLPVPEFIKEIDFHAIVLGPTFLCSRYNSAVFRQTLIEYDFVKKSRAIKIALPQDDYDCSAILDRWMVEWDISLLYTVCPDYWEVLYPQNFLAGKIKLGYTGYVSDDMINRWVSPKTHSERSIDVSYRANKLPPNFGRLGYIKGVIGDVFTRSVLQESFRLDISTSPRDLIPGNKWYDFLENSKFVLCTNSGSSLLDPENKIRESVYTYLNRNPSASFEEVEAACFPGMDGRWIFTAISPRNIESALIKTVQICTPGSYSNIMQENIHYIPIEPDCSNISDVLQMMKDVKKVENIALSCKEAVLSIDALRYRNHVAQLIDYISDAVTRQNTPGTCHEDMKLFTMKYNAWLQRWAPTYWRLKRIKAGMREVAVTLGARRLKSLLGK